MWWHGVLHLASGARMADFPDRFKTFA